MIRKKMIKMLNLNNERYIILEIIPTQVKNGDIAQLSALKINGIKLEDRFDYRLDKDLINIPDILNMINYDNKTFKYVKSTKAIINDFKKFIEDLPLLIIDNEYTNNYLEKIENKKESIFKYFDIKVDDNSFDNLITKYNLEVSNHFVDLLYEALIKEL